MRYDPSFIEQVSSLNDIVEIISAHLTLKKAGRSFKGCCPFHSEKTPSFFVNPDRQMYHCFGCGAGGDVIAFVQKIENMNFQEALEHLAARVHLELPRKNFDDSGRRKEIKGLETLFDKALSYYRKLYLGPEGAGARKYLEGRGFAKEITDDFEVGYALEQWRGLADHLSREGFSEKMLLESGLINRSSSGGGLYDLFRARVLFPIRNTQGKTIGFGGRVMTPEGKPKYLNSPETEIFKKGRELFALHMAKKHLIGETSRILIVEGYLDCLRLHSAGFKNTVATLGTALTEHHVRLLRRFAEEAILIFDGDKAGQSAAFRSLDIFLEEGFPVKVVSLEEGLDPDDYVRVKGREAFEKKLTEAQDFFEFKLNILASRYSEKDPLGLLKISGSFLEMIAKMPNEVLQEHYLKKLSRSLGVSEASLKQELAKVKARVKSAREPVSMASPAKASETFSKEEVHLLYLLAEVEGDFLTEKVQNELFSGNIIRQAFKTLMETRKDHPKGSCLSQFLARLEESEIKQKIAELSFFECSSDDRSKALKDCLQNLDLKRRQGARKDLEIKIREAERRGEVEQLAEYLKDYQSLSVKGNK